MLYHMYSSVFYLLSSSPLIFHFLIDSQKYSIIPVGLTVFGGDLTFFSDAVLPRPPLLVRLCCHWLPPIVFQISLSLQQSCANGLPESPKNLLIYILLKDQNLLRFLRICGMYRKCLEQCAVCVLWSTHCVKVFINVHVSVLQLDPRFLTHEFCWERKLLAGKARQFFFSEQKHYCLWRIMY